MWYGGCERFSSSANRFESGTKMKMKTNFICQICPDSIYSYIFGSLLCTSTSFARITSAHQTKNKKYTTTTTKDRHCNLIWLEKRGCEKLNRFRQKISQPSACRMFTIRWYFVLWLLPLLLLLDIYYFGESLVFNVHKQNVSDMNGKMHPIKS